MSDDERIEQLELENKVLQGNNKGLKAKIDELQKENEELKDYHDRTKHTIKIAKMHRKENEILKKVINLMAKPIVDLVLYDFSKKEYFTLENEDEVIEYFYKKVEKENE